MKNGIISMGFITIALYAVLLGVNPGVSQAQSYVFSNDLSLGSTGYDVVQLQTWLINSGYDIPAISAGSAAKGYFGAQTEAAVAAYERAVGLPVSGYFDVETRQYINQGGNIGGNGGGGINYPVSTFRIVSPNGGESWQRGTVQNITWVSPLNFQATYVDIKLIPYQTPCTTQICPMVAQAMLIRAPYTIATSIPINQSSYSWNVGNAQSYSPGAVTAPDGQYTIQICQTGTSVCASSSSTFTIYSNGSYGNTQPVIGGIDAPTSLTVGQLGTWTIHATDPLNGTLRYSVLWGDEAGYTLTGGAVSNPSVVQTSTFQHSYANAGVYTVKFAVINSSNSVAQTSNTVTVVSSNTTTGSLRVISPNGGEVWQKGSTQYITWTSPYYYVASYVDIKLQPSNACSVQYCTQVYNQPYTIASNISASQNSYAWVVGNVLNNVATACMVGESCYQSPAPDGQYTIQICQSGTNNCVSSDNLFTITSNQTIGAPDINIVSPNGGETWYLGSNQNISFNITGNYGQIGNNVTASLVGTNNQQIFLGSFSQGIGQGLKTFSVMVPTNIPAGSYKLLVNLYASAVNNGSYCPVGIVGCAQAPVQQAYDYSDNYFTVTANGYQYQYGYGNYSNGYINPVVCPAGYVCTPNGR